MLLTILTSGQGPFGEMGDKDAMGEAVTNAAEAARTRVDHFMMMMVGGDISSDSDGDSNKR